MYFHRVHVHELRSQTCSYTSLDTMLMLLLEIMLKLLLEIMLKRNSGMKVLETIFVRKDG